MSSKTGNTPDRLKSLQSRFAAHIRNPGQAPAPADVEDRRMAIYRNLFFNNVRSLLGWNFPVLRKLHGKEAWTQLVRDFYVEHRARTPMFPELPREFLQYLQEKRQDRDDDPPFMLELAHYEWMEKALSLEASEIDDVEAVPDGDLLAGIPVISPLAWPLSYRYPVHKIRPGYLPEQPPAEATHLLVYRDRADEVHFMRLNAVSLLLVQMLKEDDARTGHQVLNDIVAALNHPKPEVVIEGGRQLLEDFRDRDVVLGTRPD